MPFNDRNLRQIEHFAFPTDGGQCTYATTRINEGYYQNPHSNREIRLHRRNSYIIYSFCPRRRLYEMIGLMTYRDTEDKYVVLDMCFQVVSTVTCFPETEPNNFEALQTGANRLHEHLLSRYLAASTPEI